MKLNRLKHFQDKVWEFYREHGRELPWREEPTPYGVFVSEIMLQQTQVSRVQEAYPAFLKRFPSFEALAEASVTDVLSAWQGLGYNRRALWLRQAAQMIADDYGGILPREPDMLVRLPGVGPNTAGSVAAFAYEEAVVFIETNIRRVFIHHFEELTGRTVEETAISDRDLIPLIEAALDQDHPREWYWALMDYGSDLAKRLPNPNRRSKHYTVQSQFEGSVRQLRGEVLRQLLAQPKRVSELEIEDTRLGSVLAALEREGFVERKGEQLSIKQG